MRFQNLIFILVAAVTLTGCSSCDETPRNTNDADGANVNRTVNTNTNGAPNTNGNTNGDSLTSNINTVPKPKETVEAVTLKPIVAAYCDAMRKKDEAALRKIYSQAALARLLAKAKADGGNSLVEYLSIEPVGDKCQVVNETVEGNAAVAYVITQTYPDGTQFRFVKENNEWKMTDESPDVDRVEKN
jgi:hypothetical protein